ncbi:MAG TPA: hypothetical protein VMC43_03560 [Candidatus Paceibacterota bacterium]|nr:hypothetical protein [Candidatus Paceibacterota bacterium]
MEFFSSRRSLLLLTFLTLGGWLLSSASVQASELYFTPAQATYPPGGTATADLRLNNQNECINAGDITISYPKDLMDIVDISRGESIFSIWLTPPTIKPDVGLITMVGGIPGGYCGRTPGDPSVTNVIATIVIHFKPGITKLTHARLAVLDSSKLALNDGRGTPAKVVPQSVDFTIDPAAPPQDNAWTKSIADDKTPPEPFAIQVLREPTVFEGRYFAVFSTVDKQTGIDHYEILETRNQKAADDPKTVWQHVESPAVLSDQDLKSTIFVRAVDKAGNIRLAQYTPNQSPSNSVHRLAWWFAGLAVAVIAIASLFRFLPF